jgi:Rrf2 family protein
VRVALGRKGDYAVRAVLDLARHHGCGRRKAREIASEMDVPARYLPQILADLVRGGLLSAVAGPEGGYALAREPAFVTLLEVVEAAEGSIVLDECVLRGGPCDWTNACPLHGAWSRAQSALSEELRNTTFDELASVDARIEGGAYALPDGPPAHRRPTPRRGLRAGDASSEST